MPSPVFSSPEAQSPMPGATAPWIKHSPNDGHFGVVPFRRDASGMVVPGTIMAAPNGDIAWRRARAAAFDHDYVGAIELRDGVLLAQFGEVNLDALAE